MNDRIYLNNDWQFTPEYTDKLLAQDFAGDLTPVRIPHTVKELPFHYFSEKEYQMVSGYRRSLHVPAEWQGKILLLTFEGAAHRAEVFVNGVPAGEHACGYTAFTLDISKLVTYGADNLITVRLDSRESLNVPPFGFVIDYLTYGGIYRDVYLEVKGSSYIEDIFVRTDFDCGFEEHNVPVRQESSPARSSAFFAVRLWSTTFRPSTHRHTARASAPPIFPVPMKPKVAFKTIPSFFPYCNKSVDKAQVP